MKAVDRLQPIQLKNSPRINRPSIVAPIQEAVPGQTATGGWFDNSRSSKLDDKPQSVFSIRTNSVQVEKMPREKNLSGQYDMYQGNRETRSTMFRRESALEDSVSDWHSTRVSVKDIKQRNKLKYASSK